jgi:ATP-dependent DNA helicase RecG
VDQRWRAAPKVAEWIDPNLKQRENWRDWDAALLAAHRPAAPLVDGMSDPARLRLAYDEVFAHQLTLRASSLDRARGKRAKQCGNGAPAKPCVE